MVQTALTSWTPHPHATSVAPPDLATPDDHDRQQQMSAAGQDIRGAPVPPDWQHTMSMARQQPDVAGGARDRGVTGALGL